MDRRGFLTSGGAAAVATGVARSNPAQAGAPREPSQRSGAQRVSLAVASGYDLAGFGADRLARRIELASAGRFQIERVGDGADGDLWFGDACRQVALHPAFGFFAGLPLGEGLAHRDLEIWLSIGGGQLLWDELAQPFGFKPLLAGHGGDPAGLWSNVRLEAPGDLAGLTVSVAGLAGHLLKGLGANLVAVPPQDLKAALVAGRVRAAEIAGPLPAAFDLEPLAPLLYQPGLTSAGGAVTLAVRRRLWDNLAPADQALLEACAAEELGRGRAEARLHAALSGQVRVGAKWPLKQPLAPVLLAALAASARDVVAEVAGFDGAARRIAASYRAHRHLYAATA
jgi:TRAP-type mannitol/chloroaromatic compound transport system substrate-binding protein